MPQPFIPIGRSLYMRVTSGDVAQLAERCLRKAEVGGSIPLISTTPFPLPDVHSILHYGSIG